MRKLCKEDPAEAEALYKNLNGSWRLIFTTGTKETQKKWGRKVLLLQSLRFVVLLPVPLLLMLLLFCCFAAVAVLMLMMMMLVLVLVLVLVVLEIASPYLCSCF